MFTFRPNRRRRRSSRDSHGQVHFAKVVNGVVEVVGGGNIEGLFGLHGCLHDGVVGLEGIDVILIRLEDVLFDTLAETVLSNEGNDFGGVFFLGVDPADHLVHGEWFAGQSGVQFVALDHGLADSLGRLLNLGHNGRIVENAARDLAMTTPETQHQMQRRFLLNVVITQSATILQLLSGKDETLLIGRDALLVLNLGLDIVNRVGRLHIQRNGLASQGLDENLHKREGERETRR